MAQSVLEKDLEKYLIKRLEEKGIDSYKGNPIGLKGYPDREVYASKIWKVEIKVGKKLGSYYKATPWQKKWALKITASGGNYKLLTGYEEVDKFVDSLIPPPSIPKVSEYT